MSEHIIITLKEQGSRLDKFLAGKNPGQSRSKIQKAIKNGEILINGEKVPVHYFLKAGEKIKFIPGQKPAEKKPATKPAASKKLFKKIKITAQENDFLILEKPAGLLVHPAGEKNEPTLIDWLTANYPELSKIGEDPGRPAIIHRLDKKVSGLMIIPKNQTAFDFFKNQFQERKIKKKYSALVYGVIPEEETEINLAISRSRTRPGLFAAHPKNKEKNFSKKDKSALTFLKVIERFCHYTLIKASPITGRTNQIRVHLFSFGYPIVGDRLYCQKNQKYQLNLKRIFLHADSLEFSGPDGRTFKFKSPLPEELNKCLKELKK